MFSKIYTSIFLSVFFAALLCFSIYRITYDNRLDRYSDLALSGTMRLISDNILNQDEAKRAKYLEIVSRLLGAEIEEVKLKNEHLKKNVYRSDEVPNIWVIGLDNKRGIRFTFSGVSEQQFRAQALLFVSELSRTNATVSIEKLQEYSAYPVKIQGIKDTRLDEQQLSRLKLNSVVVSYDSSGKSQFSVYAPLMDESLVVIGPIPQFDNLPNKIVIIMLIVIALVIVLVAYWMVYRLDQRLSAIAGMANDFGRGALQSRVTLEGRDGITDLGNKINNMADRIEALLTSQKEIMQAVSHELRTPLSRIRFRLEMQSESSDADELSQSRVGIKKDLLELECLIDEVLEHHKLNQAPSLEKLPSNIRELVSEAISDIHPLFDTIQLDASNVIDCEHFLHKPSIKRLVDNLLKNAFKHADSRVCVSIENDDHEDRLIIEDDGVGIEPADREKIFEPFFRVDNSRNKQTGGYGLGLAIAKRIATLHFADISLDQSTLGGARFYLHIPSQSRVR